MSNCKKIVFAGDSGVGKTSIIRRFVNGEYENNGAVPTVNVDFSSKIFIVDNQEVRLQLWDTAGQEAYRSISKSYFRNAKAIILVYDVNSRSSFQSLEEWVGMIEEQTKDVPWVLFGNKSDLPDSSVSDDEATEFCEMHNVIGFRGSAKTGINIDECFYEVAQLILKSENPEKAETEIIPQAPIPINPGPKKKCC